MSLKLTSLVLTVALGAGTMIALAGGPGGPGGAPGEPGRGPAGTAPMGGGARAGRGPAIPANLSGAMSDMQRAYDAIKADAGDATKNETTLRNLAIMQRDTVISKMNIPPAVNRMTGDEKTKALTSYRSMMNGMLHTLLDLEDAVNNKKPDEIKKGLAQIEEIMKQGHAEFRPQNGRGE